MTKAVFGNRFYLQATDRPQAWDELGRNVGGIKNVADAFEMAGLTYTYSVEPITLQTGEVIDGRWAVVRSPTSDDPIRRVMGLFDKQFTVIQFADMAAMLQPLVDVTGWGIEAVGAAHLGRNVFVALRGHEFTVRRDRSPQRAAILIVNGFGGDLAYRLSRFITRLFCKNQLEALVSGRGQDRISLSHNKAVIRDGAIYGGVVAQLEAAHSHDVEVFNQLAMTALAPHQLRMVVEAAYPTPEPSRKMKLLRSANTRTGNKLSDEARELLTEQERTHELARQRAGELQAATLGELMERYNASSPESANTAWAVVQAVAEMADNHAGRDGAAGTLWGDRAQERARALRMAMELSGIPLAEASAVALPERVIEGELVTA